MELLKRLQIAPQLDVELEDPLPQDPAPDEPAPKRKTGSRKAATPTPRAARPPTVAKMARDVAADLATFLEMGAAAWGLTDQCCAPVLAEQSKPIADALTAILARNPRLLARFAQADTAVWVMQVAALVRACTPVARAVYANHVTAPEQEGGNGAGLPLDHFPAYHPVA